MASIRASSATAATELKLINSVELKLALASDQGFERLLVVYLCPLILKLASASPQSVEKTRSVLSMIDVRVRGGIYKLPTKTLLVQYHSAVLQQVVRSTALQYLDCALEMSVVENPIALFELFRGFSAATTTQQSTIFNMVCRIFGSMHKGDISARGNINCPQTPSLLLDDETALAARFLDLMFLNLAYFKLQPTGALGESIVPSGDDVRLRLQSAKACLTLDQIEFLNPKGAQTFTVSSLNESRHGLLRFLAQPNSAALFHSSARYLIALVGSFDLDDDTKKLASVLIRHCPARDDYQFALSLYHLILERENPPHQLRSRVFQLLGGNTVATTMVGSAYRALEIGLDCAPNKHARYAAIGFLRAFVLQGPSPTLQERTEKIVNLLARSLQTGNSNVEARECTYTALGLLDPSFTRANVHIVEILLRALSRDRVAYLDIQASLLGLAPIYRGAEAEASAQLAEILVKIVLTEDSHVHRAILDFTLATFDFQNVAARWICLLVMQVTNFPDAIKTARDGLELSLFKLVHPGVTSMTKYPILSELLTWPDENIFKRSYRPSVDLIGLDTEVLSGFTRLATTAFYAHVLPSILQLKDQESARIITSIITCDFQAREMLRSYCQADSRHSEDSQPLSGLSQFRNILVDVFIMHQIELAGQTIVDLIKFDPSWTSSFGVSHLNSFRTVALSPRSNLSGLHGAEIFAAAIVNNMHSVPTIEHQIITLLQDTTGATKIRVHAILAKILLRTYVCGRTLTIDLIDWERSLLHDLEVTTPGGDTIHKLQTIHDLALTRSMRLRSDFITLLMTSWARFERTSELTMLVRIARSLVALSTALDSTTSQFQEIVQTLLSVDYHDIEFSLSIGDALASLLGRWQSRSLLVLIDVPYSPFLDSEEASVRAETLPHVLGTLHKQLASSSKYERRGAFFKLLSILQLISGCEMSADLVSIHSAILELVTGKDETLAEAAVRGLHSVHTRATPKQQEQMLTQIYRLIRPSKLSSVQDHSQDHLVEMVVPGSSEAYSNPELENSFAKFYKDVCSLCAEAGDKSLVYDLVTFMSMESIFSMRQELILGFRSTAADPTVAGTIELKSTRVRRNLLAKLYRSKYDPSPSTSSRFQQMYDGLFPLQKYSIGEEFDYVMNDLLDSTRHHSWKIREAAFNALSSLVRAGNSVQIRGHIESLLDVGFFALDDATTSVTEAAVPLCQILCKLVLKPHSGQDRVSPSDSSMLELILPLLLTQLRSSSKNISSFSLSVLLEITKSVKDNSTLQRYLPALIEEYFLLTSDLEPAFVNYISFHLEKYELSQAELDQHRLTSIKGSPIFDALEQCVDHLDDHSAQLAMPKIFRFLGQNHGLPTHASLSTFFISTSLRKPGIMSRYADEAIRVLSMTMQNRNGTVMSLYATTIGYLTRFASEDRVHKLISFVTSKETEDNRSVLAGLIIKAISQHANEKFNALGALFLPLCFLAMHDPDEKINHHFQAVWNSSTGSNAAIKVYLRDIFQLFQHYMNSPVWRKRQMAARASSTLISAVTLQTEEEEELFKLLKEALSGRMWAGKELLLDGLVALLKTATPPFENAYRREIRTILIKEALRSSLEYKVHVLFYFAKFLQLDTNYDSFQDVHDTLVTIQDSTTSSDSTEKVVLFENSINCLAQAFRPSIDEKRLYHYRALLSYYSSRNTTDTSGVRLCLLQGLQSSFVRIAAIEPFFWTEIDITKTWGLLKSLLPVPQNPQSVWEEAVSTVRSFCSACELVKPETVEVTAILQTAKYFVLQNENTMLHSCLMSPPIEASEEQ